MKFVTLRELKISPSKVLKGLSGGSAVVTKGGKPAAALVYLDEDLLDEFVLAHHPTFLKEVAASRREYERKGGISHDEMLGRVKGRRG